MSNQVTSIANKIAAQKLIVESANAKIKQLQSKTVSKIEKIAVRIGFFTQDVSDEAIEAGLKYMMEYDGKKPGDQSANHKASTAAVAG